MGKKAKTGKARKDKFYHLAKETGYRSRAAFKLIQLNRKYEFLQKSRVVIDLCAAPGGWLQVVAENTPMSSIIIGVDLVPIKAIRNVSTFMVDITTSKCKQTIKKELHTWKADCVLNDGAPNIGKNWVYDAFQQVSLTLAALKVATEFLRKGGWFVTKVFRSQEYFSLLWVLQQLFKNVHATKPQASRNTSAEIFVVCQNYLAPDKLDPKFLDPKFVFKDVNAEPKMALSLIHPEKITRHRDGYPEGDHTLYHTLSVTDFLKVDDYLERLACSNALVFDDDAIASHSLTTVEIKECCRDIKVLNKKDLRLLISWRNKIRKEFVKAEEKDPASEVPNEESEEDDEAKLDERIIQLQEADDKVNKKKVKKTRKLKAKLQKKMDLKMILPGDRHDFIDDVMLFNLAKIKNKKQLHDVESGDWAQASGPMEADDESEWQSQKKPSMMYDRDTKDYLDPNEASDMSEDEDESELSFEDESDVESAGETMEESTTNDNNPLVVPLEDISSRQERKRHSWFSKDAFAGLEDDQDEDIEIGNMVKHYKEKGGIVTGENHIKNDKSKLQIKSVKKTREGNLSKKDTDSKHFDSEGESDGSESDYEASTILDDSTKSKVKDKGAKKAGFEIVKANKAGDALPTTLDPVGLAIGAAMSESRKRRREVIEGAYNRYMSNDSNLPEWFSKDEKRHCRLELPVTKQEITDYRERQRAIDARPIKKVVEAKARKKRKELKRTERARKKAEVITDAVDVSDREKWQQIKQIYQKAGLLKNKKKEVTYVFAKKGTGKRARRPGGVTGPYKVVDRRMKKDARQQKAQAKGKKGKRK